MKQKNAVEYGILSTKLLIMLHTLYYIFVVIEVYTRLDGNLIINSQFYAGLILYVFSFLILCKVVYDLGEYWTVKLYICPNHKKIDTFLFRNFKHPNYYLNIIPELIAVALIFNTWLSLIIIAPFYMATLFSRIKQENKLIASL